MGKKELVGCITVIYGGLLNVSLIASSTLPYEHSYCFTNRPKTIADQLR